MPTIKTHSIMSTLFIVLVMLTKFASAMQKQQTKSSPSLDAVSILKKLMLTVATYNQQQKVAEAGKQAKIWLTPQDKYVKEDPKGKDALERKYTDIFFAFISTNKPQNIDDTSFLNSLRKKYDADKKSCIPIITILINQEKEHIRIQQSINKIDTNAQQLINNSKKYLQKIELEFKTLLQGCTHFPLLTRDIHKQIARSQTAQKKLDTLQQQLNTLFKPLQQLTSLVDQQTQLFNTIKQSVDNHTFDQSTNNTIQANKQTLTLCQQELAKLPQNSQLRINLSNTITTLINNYGTLQQSIVTQTTQKQQTQQQQQPQPQQPVQKPQPQQTVQQPVQQLPQQEPKAITQHQQTLQPQIQQQQQQANLIKQLTTKEQPLGLSIQQKKQIADVINTPKR